jgi:hypothetical protein
VPASPPSLSRYPGPGWSSPTVNSFLVGQPALNIIRLLLDLTEGTPRKQTQPCGLRSNTCRCALSIIPVYYPMIMSHPMICSCWEIHITLLYFTLLSWIRHCGPLVDPPLKPLRGSDTEAPSWIRHCVPLVDPPLWFPRGSATVVPSWIRHCTVVHSWIRHCGSLVDPPLWSPRRSAAVALSLILHWWPPRGSDLTPYPLPHGINDHHPGIRAFACKSCLILLTVLRKNCSCVNITIKSLFYPCFTVNLLQLEVKKMTPH